MTQGTERVSPLARHSTADLPPFYLRSNVFTMPEFLERRFNRACAVYLASERLLPAIESSASRGLATGLLSHIPGILPAAALFIMIIGLLSAAGPPRRAIRVNPTEALRDG